MDLSIFVEGREDGVFDELRAADPVHWNAPSERRARLLGADALRRREGSGERRRRASRRRTGRRSSTARSRASSRACTTWTTPSTPSCARSPSRSCGRSRSASGRTPSTSRWRCCSTRPSSTAASTWSTWWPRGCRCSCSRASWACPPQDGPRMVDWTNRLTSSDPDHAVAGPALAEARDEVMAYFERLTAQRREQPEDDLVSVLAQRHRRRPAADLGGAGRVLHRRSSPPATRRPGT